MKTFAQYVLTESAPAKVMTEITNYIKYLEAFKGHKDADLAYAEKRMNAMARVHNIDLDALKAKVLAEWTPGKCPGCHGCGFAEGRDHAFCHGTGLQGMTDAQAHWWLEKKKEVDQLIQQRRDPRKFAGESHEDVLKMKLVSDILKAANRLGMHPNIFEEAPHDPYAEDVQEPNFWWFQLREALYSICEHLAEKTGWKWTSI